MTNILILKGQKILVENLHNRELKAISDFHLIIGQIKWKFEHRGNYQIKKEARVLSYSTPIDVWEEVLLRI